MSQKQFKGSVTPIIKKSLSLEPPKIGLKMINRHFSLGGGVAEHPPASDRVITTLILYETKLSKGYFLILFYGYDRILRK